MPISSANLFAASRSYVLAMRALIEKIEHDDQKVSAPLAMPFYFLGGFACELGLKAAIFAVQRDERALIRISHNLRSCFVEAERTGFQSSDRRRAVDLIENFASAHADHSFRYVPSVDQFDVPDPHEALEAIDWMLREISDQIDVWSDLR